MTIEEAVLALKRYQGYEPMEDGNILKHSFDLTDETVDTLLSAMRTELAGEALTMEQLREMDGKPMWVERNEEPYDGKWFIVDHADVENPDKTLYTKEGVTYSDYGKYFTAYAYPPAHIDREAWTAEWRELHGDKMVGLDDCGDDVYRHYHYSVCTSCGKGNAVKSNFCPVCGKAMTPDAWAELEKRMGVTM